MNMLLVGPQDLRMRWHSLFEVFFPKVKILEEDTKDNILKETNEVFKLVVFLPQEMDNFFLQYLSSLQNKSVPILCMVDKVNFKDYHTLLSNGVSGIISQDSSLDILRNAIHLVSDGGMYFEASIASHVSSFLEKVCK
ncbi:response regulator transcription factor [Bacillus cihuensis]|uniref:response regulator transcription factor n=1 Tax=Bacillus cihuensis TaxID=1208599 RepID=UPI0012693253|nr:response regulator transcription factor [Bacillus cihuensis]